MKKFSLTHKLLAVALAFVLVAVSLPDYLSFAQQPAQEQSETDELADGDPSDTGEQEMEQQVVLHLQAPETVPMGTAGSFGLSAQNTAATAADVSIQLTQEEMAAYQAAEQDSTLALQPVGDSLTFTLQPGEQVEGTLSFRGTCQRDSKARNRRFAGSVSEWPDSKDKRKRRGKI